MTAGGRHGGRRRRTVAVLDAAQARNVLLVLSITIRKYMTAGSVGNEVEFLGARRIGGGLQRRAARISDRPRRQAINRISIVRCRLFNLTLEDRPAQRPLAASQPVNDRRVRLQPHLALEAIDEYRCNTGALLRPAGFFFDDRGQYDQLLGKS